MFLDGSIRLFQELLRLGDGGASFVSIQFLTIGNNFFILSQFTT
jgi:hypothetical protein